MNVPYRVVEKESAYFDFEILSRYYKNVNKITAKNISSKCDTLQGYLLNTLPAPAHDLKPRCKEIYPKSGNPEGGIQLKAFLCGSFSPVKVGSVAGLYSKSSFFGDIYLQFIMASHTLLGVNCCLSKPFCDWKEEKTGSCLNKVPKLLQGSCQIYEHATSKCHRSALEW